MTQIEDKWHIDWRQMTQIEQMQTTHRLKTNDTYWRQMTQIEDKWHRLKTNDTDWRQMTHRLKANDT